MFAGSIARLDRPTDEPLSTTFRDGQLPGLDVRNTQTRMDAPAVQTGKAANTIQVDQQQIVVSTDNDGDTRLSDYREPTPVRVVTNWVADPQESGLIAAESTGGDGPFDFPFDIFAAVTDRTPERLKVNIEQMYDDWQADGSINDVWMNGTDDGERSAIGYHERADASQRPNIGIGFVRAHGNTVQRGVVYESGYVALYNCNSAAAFVSFVAECILPFCYRADDGGTQQTL